MRGNTYKNGQKDQVSWKIPSTNAKKKKQEMFIIVVQKENQI